MLAHDAAAMASSSGSAAACRIPTWAAYYQRGPRRAGKSNGIYEPDTLLPAIKAQKQRPCPRPWDTASDAPSSNDLESGQQHTPHHQCAQTHTRTTSRAPSGNRLAMRRVQGVQGCEGCTRYERYSHQHWQLGRWRRRGESRRCQPVRVSEGGREGGKGREEARRGTTRAGFQQREQLGTHAG